jgi:hypothetical protein
MSKKYRTNEPIFVGVLGIGYWVLGIGYWVLGIGYWVLGIDYFYFGFLIEVNLMRCR